MIPYGKQLISPEDIEAVVNVLKGDWLTQGPTIRQFEQAMAECVGTKYAVAVSNGTAALHIACLAAELGSGERLWTSPNTFVASANCALYCGAQPDFVDIDSKTYNLSPNALEEKLSKAEQEKTLPKIVVPVHFAGQSCEMEPIYRLSKRYNFILLEDAAHALGGTYRGIPSGACEFSDMAVFSFHPVKLMTTGEGGMVLTNRTDLYEKLIRLRTHGITRDIDLMQGKSHGPWYYQQLELGFNYRMTDIQAALGLSQLQQLNEFVKRRRFLAHRYNQFLRDLPLTIPWQHPDTNSGWHLYVIRLKLHELTKTRRQVFEELRQKGIGVNVHYIPVHTQPYYQRLGFKLGDFPEAECYYQEALSIPLYYGLTETEQDMIINTLQEVLQ